MKHLTINDALRRYGEAFLDMTIEPFLAAPGMLYYNVLHTTGDFLLGIDASYRHCLPRTTLNGCEVLTIPSMTGRQILDALPQEAHY